MDALKLKRTLAEYRSTFAGTRGYIAGLPSYPRNFSRDVFLAGMLAMDEDMLETQIRLAAEHQGMGDDRWTGEEVGKIHHEFPGVKLPGRGRYYSTYNACDTTALFVLAFAAMGELNPYRHKELVATYYRQIVLAVAYLLHHTRGNIFYEFPPAGADRFCLRVTYWKDSIVPDRSGNEEFAYPVAYALSHFIAARALMTAGSILNAPELAQVGDTMTHEGIRQFIRSSEFVVARGEGFKLAQASSDELHCLVYIPSRFSRWLPLAAMRRRAQSLVTPAGIACTPQLVAETLEDGYHGYVVWPFEQALIHYGCQKFGMTDLAETAARVVPYIDDGNELLEVAPRVVPAGNNRQLWSVAAQVYFAPGSRLREDAWL